MTTRPILLVIAVALCACTGGPDDPDGVITTYGDRYAVSRHGANGLATELRATTDDALLASMSIAPDGTATWSRDGVTQPIQTTDVRTGAVVERQSATTIGEVPADERSANDLLYHLDLATPEPPEVASADCEVHGYDNMTCVTCREDDGTYCYHCSWIDPWGQPEWYMQCTGGGGGKGPFHPTP